MEILCCIFILNCWIRGARFQSILLQAPAEILAEKGEQVELSCNSAKLPLGRVFWYKLDEDSASHFVISTDLMDNVRRGNGISSRRFALIRSTFSSSFSLVIKDLQLADNGTYHCLMHSSQTTLMGGGSAVTVVPEKQRVTPPPTTKPPEMNRPRNPRWRNKKKKMNKGYVCDWSIWGALTACNLVLLISIIFVIVLRRRRHYQRQCPHQFRKR